MNTLNGHIALVTGSSRGIGAAIAAELARCGAAVAVGALGADSSVCHAITIWSEEPNVPLSPSCI